MFNATSSAQPPETSWALVELLGEHAPPLVISGVNLWRDDRGHAGARRLARALLPLGAPRHLDVDMGALDLGVGERLQNRMGILFADARQALLNPLKTRNVDPFQGVHNQYTTPALSDEQKLIDNRYTLLVATQTTEGVVAANVATYRHFGEFVHDRGGHLLYLLPPSAPGSAAILEPLEPRARGALAPLAAAGEVLDLRTSVVFDNEEFYDSVHMLAGGRSRFWPVLEQALLARIPGCRSPSP